MPIFTFLFFFALSIVFYTYIGYGILLYILVKIKEKLHPEQPLTLPEPLPDVTLLIAAYNEEKVIKANWTIARCSITRKTSYT